MHVEDLQVLQLLLPTTGLGSIKKVVLKKTSEINVRLLMNMASRRQ